MGLLPFTLKHKLTAAKFWQAVDRLDRDLSNLRSEYHYCFWCGTQYDDAKDLLDNCLGITEDTHD